jgi:hypothetical protein
MNSSKFFAAVLITSASVFAGSAAQANPPAPLPNTTVPTTLNCGCTTAASIVKDGDRFGASIAQGNYKAKTSAELNKSEIKTNAEAESYKVKPPHPVYSATDAD